MKLSKERVEEIVSDEPEAVEDFKNGEEGAVNYLVGCIMQETGGCVNPTEAKEVLEEYLKNRIVEVTLPYRDAYGTSEKIAEIDGIPDTDEAYDRFRYAPEVMVTFEWDKDADSLEPVSVTIDQTEYTIE